MSSTLADLLNIQEKHDQILSYVDNLRTIIKRVAIAKKFAEVAGVVSIDDIVAGKAYQTHVCMTYVPFVSMLSQYIRSVVPVTGMTNGTPIECQFDTGNANFVGDIMVYIQFPAISAQSLVVLPGMPPPVPGYGRVRYCSLPGIRYFQKLELLINQKTVEVITWENYIDYMQNELNVSKLRAFEQCVGQEQPRQAKFGYTFDGAGQPMPPGQQLWCVVADGPQTPKDTQPPMSIFMPLIFSWCRDKQFLMSCKFLSPSQRSIRITPAPMSKIVSHYNDVPMAVVPSDFRPSAFIVYSRAIFAGEDIAKLFERKQKHVVHCWKTIKYPIWASGSFTQPIDEVAFLVECLYVKFTPHINNVEPNALGGGVTSTYDYWWMPAHVVPGNVAVPFLGAAFGTGTVYQNAVVYRTDSLLPIVSTLQLQIQ
jgi:hypothetical protein